MVWVKLYTCCCYLELLQGLLSFLDQLQLIFFFNLFQLTLLSRNIP